MTICELEEITARHEALINASTATLASHTDLLTKLTKNMALLLKGRQDDVQNPPPPPPTSGIQGRPLRLDFSRFEGTEPESWLFQVEQFFALNPLPADQQVTMASIHLKGDAISWYRWLHQSLGDLTWPQFSTAICKHFGSRQHIDPMSSLSKLTQQGTIQDYITKFENILNLVHGINIPHQTSMFLSGLRPDLQAGVRLHTPTSLGHAFELALRQEDAILATTGYVASEPASMAYVRPPQLPPVKSTTRVPPQLPTGVKRLSWDEQQRRREKGLCFNCDDLYKLGHRCATPQLLLMDAFRRYINAEDVFSINDNGLYTLAEAEPPDGRHRFNNG